MDIKTDTEKGRELQAILFELAKSQEFMEDKRVRAEVYRKLENLYYLPKGEENYRHLYSDIFAALITIQRDSTKGNIDILVQNLDLVWKGYQAQNIYQDGQLIDISESIRKLYDHVSLDVARLRYSDSHREITDLGIQVSGLYTELEKAQKEQKALQDKADNLEGKLADTQKEYISILGIFSAVVLAFMSGSMFSSSVLESIASTNIYRTIFIVDFLAFTVISLVYLLVAFILKIHKMPQTEQSPVRCKWFAVFRSAREKRFFPIRAVYCVCFVVAVLDVLAWMVDFGRMARYITSWLPWLH